MREGKYPEFFDDGAKLPPAVERDFTDAAVDERRTGLDAYRHELRHFIGSAPQQARRSNRIYRIAPQLRMAEQKGDANEIDGGTASSTVTALGSGAINSDRIVSPRSRGAVLTSELERFKA
jgi:hypothetical protein